MPNRHRLKPNQNGITWHETLIKTAMNFQRNSISFTRVANALNGEPIFPLPALFGIGGENAETRTRKKKTIAFYCS
jgi:hypothetical protein